MNNPTFATSPSLLNAHIVDLNTKLGYKLHETAINAVYSTHFDGSKEEVQELRDHVHTKAIEQGWSSGPGNIFTG